jgi:hypothetical protein
LPAREAEQRVKRAQRVRNEELPPSPRSSRPGTGTRRGRRRCRAGGASPRPLEEPGPTRTSERLLGAERAAEA